MTSELITSSSNPLVKRLRRLRARKQREREGSFLVEGITQVWRALEHGAGVELLVVAPELLSSEAALEMVAAEEAAGRPVARLERSLFEQTTEREHPSGLAAIVTVNTVGLADLEPGAASVFVALKEVGNPGNLGSILRTLDAIGGAGLIVVGSSTDQFHPAAVKASMGALFTVPVARAPDLGAVYRWAKTGGVKVVATSAHAERAYWDGDLAPPAVLVFGSEAQGLSSEELDAADEAIRIPMEGSVTSLNLAVSAGILLYELRRRAARDP